MSTLTAAQVFDLYFDSSIDNFDDYYLGEYSLSRYDAVAQYAQELIESGNEQAIWISEQWDMFELEEELLNRTCGEKGYLFRQSPLDTMCVVTQKKDQDQLSLF
jgi:hypothetical protein